MVEPVEHDSRGLVQPQQGLQHFSLERRAPAADVARFIDRYWFVEWDLPPGQVHVQEVVLHPVVNVVFEEGRGVAGGPNDERFARRLRATGGAVGVMSRPGGFRAFTDLPANGLRNRQVPVGELWGREGERLAADLAGAAGDIEAQKAILDDWFGARVQPRRHPCERVADVVDLVIADPTMYTVEALASVAHISVRQLQRLFHRDVGMTPKQVIRRYRIYEVAERVAHGEHVHWATVAADLGFADQAHLTREFTELFGMPPATYARMASAGA